MRQLPHLDHIPDIPRGAHFVAKRRCSMATTTTPSSVSSESSPVSIIISVVALVAIVALLYYIARGATKAQLPPAGQPAQQQMQQEPQKGPVAPQ